MVAVDGEHRQPNVDVGVGKVDQPATTTQEVLAVGAQQPYYKTWQTVHDMH
jgi:hypothetical protein